MMRVFALAFLALAVANHALVAQERDVSLQTRLAIEALEQATQDMERAESARDRAIALTQVVRSYEKGLSALRAATRLLATNAQAITSELQEHEGRTASLIAVLQVLETRPAPSLLLHPGGPAGGLRAGLLLSDIVPRLDIEAAALRSSLEQLQALNELQTDAQQQLENGLHQLQEARRKLMQAVANRTPLPKRFTTDPVAEAILIDTARSLEVFARELDRLAAGTTAGVMVPASEEGPPFPLPVIGSASALDVSPGIEIATRADAVVASPTNATVRYAGPLLDLGEAVILEPMPDVLFVFAGLDRLFVTAGDIVPADAPLGLMGGRSQENAAAFSIDSDQSGAALPETLYIEVRKSTVPQDPTLWFQTEQDG